MSTGGALDPALAKAAPGGVLVVDYGARGGLGERGIKRAARAHPIPTACAVCSFLPSVLIAGATMTSTFWKL